MTGYPLIKVWTRGKNDFAQVKNLIRDRSENNLIESSK